MVPASRKLTLLAALLGLLAVVWPPLADPVAAATDRPANRLIDSANPYLLLHAHNPVDWYPWGPEALEAARREGKPIFVSIGYSTCYWCHVAERTLYRDPAIAKLMNKWFINVKVDREERPDLDAIFMLARQLLTGDGGWPNNLFLTPDGKPFFAGSYFPPKDDDVGRPGFPRVLATIHEAWVKSPEEVRTRAALVAAALQERQARAPGAGVAPVAPLQWRSTARDRILTEFDTVHGGIIGGRGSKFPQEPMLGLLLADYRASGDARSLEALTRALDAIGFGGIHDHLGGGFHRYTVEPTWSIPHFEKMLYNNAQLLRLYAETYALTRNTRYRFLAIETAEYLERRMMDARGGFYTAEDALVGEEEGLSYQWTEQQIRSVLGERDAQRFFAVYSLTPMPQRPAELFLEGIEPGVLRIRVPLPPELSRLAGRDWQGALETLAPLRAKLAAARAQREQPARDEKMIVALNGLAIDALARSGRILARRDYVVWATRAGTRMWDTAFDASTGELKHQVYRGVARGAGFLDDYALLGVGFLALRDATGDTVWGARARAIASAMLKRFGRVDGSLALTPHGAALLIDPPDEGDRVIPSGTSAAFALLQRLGDEEASFARAARGLLRQMAPRVGADPTTWPTLVAVARVEATPAAASFDTADYVQVAAHIARSTEHDKLVVTLTIAAGFHTNANPATFDYLVPTSISIAGATPTRIDYPKAQRVRPAFAPEGLDLYDGRVRIVATFPKGALGVRVQGAVRAQACNDEVCLAPAEIPWSAAR